jgi:hypothetical protein
MRLALLLLARLHFRVSRWHAMRGVALIECSHGLLKADWLLLLAAVAMIVVAMIY